jgi:hypothetical protein
MENKILRGLNFNNFMATKPVLKPLNLQNQLNKNNTIDIKDTISSSISTRKPVLLNPLQLFSNISNSSISNQNNLSIIEKGVSLENTNAIKKFEGKTWLGKLDSNSNRDVAIIIPKGVDYTKPFEIMYYFHGHNGKLDRILTEPNYGLEKNIKDMPKDKNVIIVIPQGPPKSQDFTWMNGKYGEDMTKFQDDTMNIVKNKLGVNAYISSVTVQGHSAGGRPIMNAANQGKLRADKIDLLDSSYGTWATQAYDSYKKVNPNVKFNVVYIPNSQTQADALRLKGKDGVTLHQSKVDHSSVPKKFFGL